MRTQFRTIVTVGFVLGVTAVTAAQVNHPRNPTNLEVRQLVARGRPADHARLRDHFTALGDQYEADAKRHNEMARAFLLNPGRRVAVNRSSDHCNRLADLAAQSAATARELAAHHDRLAAGIPSTAPKNSARFEAGAGARVVEEHEKEMHDLAANAKTAADHRAIADYFESVERQYNKDVTEHSAMAQAYRGAPNRRGGDPAVHCDRLVRLSREAAKEAGAIAADHKQAADAAR